MQVAEWRFGLETDDEEPEETTVYGVEAGEALDQLLEALGVPSEAVLDRVDGPPEARDAASAIEVAEAAEAVASRASAIQDHLQEYVIRLSAIEARVAREAYNRQLAAVAEWLGEELTERERTAHRLLTAGWSTEEAAKEMGVTPATVRKYNRHLVERWRSVKKRPAITDIDAPTLRERIVAMRNEGLTLQAIADRLNDEGVPTLREGSAWRPSSVQSLVGYRRTRHVRKNVERRKNSESG